jgi:hypothetical protein
MYEVSQQEPSDDFTRARSYAGQHIQKQTGGGLKWLRADLNPPMAEHLSFRMGNQIFFIFVEAAEFNYHNSSSLFLRVSREAAAVPCIMKMTQRISAWEPFSSGWGLVHAESGELINPPAMVSDALIEMSKWELHDFAIQIVTQHLKREGKKVFSKQSSTEIDPSIWFEDVSGPAFVIVRCATYPQQKADIPENITNIKNSCARLSDRGYFASVSVANASNFELPPYRGHGMHVRFSGMVDI